MIRWKKINKNIVDECLEDVLYDFDYIDDDSFCLTQIICDSKEIRDMIFLEINRSRRVFVSMIYQKIMIIIVNGWKILKIVLL